MLNDLIYCSCRKVPAHTIATTILNLLMTHDATIFNLLMTHDATIFNLLMSHEIGILANDTEG